jgi:hypothetical protein
MNRTKTWSSVAVLLTVGIAVGWILNARQPAMAGSGSDRFQDYILATGPVNQAFSNNAQFVNAELDGVWLLDYKSGKLLASCINRQNGKMISWDEMDLVKEFELAPRSDVHFMMTTGVVVKGQSVLYLVETNSGKFGVYSMTADEAAGGNGKCKIRRHDMTTIRGQAPMQSQQHHPQQPQQPVMNPPNFLNPPTNPVQQAGFNGNR